MNLDASKDYAKVGRDHWPRGPLMAGGGMKHGQVIGATDSQAAEPADRPVASAVFATLYHHLGIDPSTLLLLTICMVVHRFRPGEEHLSQSLFEAPFTPDLA